MARDITNAAFCTSEAGTFANTKTSQQQPAEWAAALHGFSAPSAFSSRLDPKRHDNMPSVILP